MKNELKEYLKIIIPVCGLLISVAITPIVKLYSRVQVLEERMSNRKKDISTLYILVDKLEAKAMANDKDIYITIGALRERIASLEAKSINNNHRGQ